MPSEIKGVNRESFSDPSEGSLFVASRMFSPSMDNDQWSLRVS